MNKKNFLLKSFMICLALLPTFFSQTSKAAVPHELTEKNIAVCDNTALKSQRPEIKDCLFRSDAIENKIAWITSRLRNPYLE